MHVRRVPDVVHAVVGTAGDDHIRIAEDRRAERPFGADERHHVGLGGSIEVPDAGAGNRVPAGERGGGDVLDRVGAPGIQRETSDARHRPAEEVDQVNAVRAKVEEQAATGNRGIHAPDGFASHQRRGHLDMHRRDRPMAPPCNRSRTRRNRGSARR